jgi:hypothetical protein
MEIKTNYYYRSQDGVLRQGGLIVFNRYRILSVEGRELTDKGVVYYSSPADETFKVSFSDTQSQTININRIITEKEYTSNQMEYYVWLSLINQHKFKWINIINPLSPVFEAFRYAFLGMGSFQERSLLISFGGGIFLFFAGLISI